MKPIKIIKAVALIFVIALLAMQIGCPSPTSEKSGVVEPPDDQKKGSIDEAVKLPGEGAQAGGAASEEAGENCNPKRIVCNSDTCAFEVQAPDGSCWASPIYCMSEENTIKCIRPHVKRDALNYYADLDMLRSNCPKTFELLTAFTANPLDDAVLIPGDQLPSNEYCGEEDNLYVCKRIILCGD